MRLNIPKTLGLIVGLVLLSACQTASSGRDAKLLVDGYASNPQNVHVATSLIGGYGASLPQLFLMVMEERLDACDVAFASAAQRKVVRKTAASAFPEPYGDENFIALVRGVDKNFDAILVVEELIKYNWLHFYFYFDVRYYDPKMDQVVWRDSIFAPWRLNQEQTAKWLPGEILKRLAADGILSDCTPSGA